MSVYYAAISTEGVRRAKVGRVGCVGSFMLQVRHGQTCDFVEVFTTENENIASITFWSTSVAATTWLCVNKLIINLRLRVICVHRSTLVKVIL